MWYGKWIWIDAEEAPINFKLLARKKFPIKDVPNNAILKISADTRYRLYINGQWVNDGPIRSFPSRYSVDVIEVSKYLRVGENVIAVEVYHWGEGTFQSVVVRGGLLVELWINERPTVVSDSTWKVCPDPSWDRFSPRVSCQLPFVEYIDARKGFWDWTFPSFDDTDWPSAIVIADPKDGPWRNLHTRPIKLLTTETIYPKRIVWTHSIYSPIFTETINIKRAFYPEKNDANHRCYDFSVILTEITSADKQSVTFLPDISGAGPIIKCAFINDRDISSVYQKNISEKVTLNKGSNILVWIIEGDTHFDEPTLIIDVGKQISIRNPFGKGKWAIAGPIRDEKLKQRFKNIKHIAQLDDLRSLFRPVDDFAHISEDVYPKIVFRKLLNRTPKLINAENMFYDNDEPTIIPQQDDSVEILIDFGKETNSYIEFELLADEGAVLDFAFFEYLDTDKSKIHYPTGNRSVLRYVTRKGWQRFISFRHFGFRYVILTLRKISSEVRIRKLCAHFVHYPVSYKGSFVSSDKLLDTLWDVSAHTLLCCMEDTFTDCPLYEQTYWVGDARNEALVSHYVFGVYEFTARCSRLPGYSLKDSPLTISQVPSAWKDIIPAWSFLWVQMCWDHYIHSADMKTLKQVYPHIKKMLTTCKKQFTDKRTGLFAIDAWNMFDWAKVDDNHKIVAHNNAFLIAAYIAAAKMAKVMNNRKDRSEWENQISHLKTAINKHLWDEERNAYVDSIHDDGSKSNIISRQTNTLMFLYDIAPKDRAERIKPIILGERIDDIVQFGSPFATFYLLECLAKMGKFDLLINIIRQEWGKMVDSDSTTFWETFANSPYSPQGFPTRSYCHGWSSAPAYFLSRYILGIYPLVPGFKKTLIAPVPCGLTFAKGSVPTPFGNIYVKWEIKGEKFEIKVTKPPAIQCRIVNPSSIDRNTK